MVEIPENYVKLEPNRPKRMLIKDWQWETREIVDPNTKSPKTVKVMTFNVTQEDGEPVQKPFSALSTKLQQSLAPLIESGQLFHRMVEITWYPRGYATDYAVHLL